MKLLLDMNLPPHWGAKLSNLGLEAIHWSSVGAPNAVDIEIMNYANEHDLVVITHDLDFSAILAVTQGKKPSVVQIRTVDLRWETIGDALVVALRQTTQELEEGALLTFDPKRTRLRILPLCNRM